MTKGGSIQGEIDALNRLVEMTVPPFPLAFREDRTYLIPGHGFVCDFADLVEYRSMVTIVRDRIRDMVDKAMTVEQVKAADPTREGQRIPDRSGERAPLRRSPREGPPLRLEVAPVDRLGR